MEFMVFQLRAAFASWGETAVGEYRGSHEHPSESALIGLLGAACGVTREDDTAQARLRDGYAFIVATLHAGRLLRDYHTAQTPSRAELKGWPHRTRRDELAVPKLNTVLSMRDYREGAHYLVAVTRNKTSPYALSDLVNALRQPRFTLYLGRKSCPPTVPLHPLLIEAESARHAFDRYQEDLLSRAGVKPLPITRMSWSTSAMDIAGANPDLSVPRKDRLISRRSWQFGDRVEHIALEPASQSAEK